MPPLGTIRDAGFMPQKHLRRPRAAIIAVAVTSRGVLGFGATVANRGRPPEPGLRDKDTAHEQH